MASSGCVGCGRDYGLCRCDRPYLGAALNRLPTRILDVLDVDSGWWTTEGLADRLDAKPDSVARALYRLVRRGLIERRVLELVGSVSAQYVPFSEKVERPSDVRIEWRLA